MKLKIKKSITKKALSKVGMIDSSWTWCNRARDARDRGDTALRELVWQQWMLHFECEPPQDVHLEMLRIKLAYHIEYVEKISKGVILSAHFLRNYKAAMALDLEGFDKDMRFLMELAIKYRGVSPEKEEEMKVKRKAAAVKAQATKAKSEVNKGPKKGATWVELFKANFTKKLTDTELAKAMTKAMGDGHTYTEQEVVKNRGFYNFGAFGKNYPKPKTALEQFKDEKPEPKKADKKSKK